MINKAKLQAKLRRQRRKGLRGIRYAPSLAIRYERNLLQLVRQLTKEAIGYVNSLKAQRVIHDSYPRFNLQSQMEKLDAWADATAKAFADGTEEFHRKKWRSELNAKTGIDVKKVLKQESIKPAIDRAVKANVDLIKSIPKEFHEKISNAIDSGILGGDDSVTLKQAVKEIGDVTESRARLIARDQTSKLLSDLNKERQTELGVTSYVWVTAGDDRVRETHAANDGKTFRWDSPPGETGHPGEDVQCRCVADPVLDDLWLKVNET